MLEYLEKLTSFYPVSDDQVAVKRLLDYVADFLKSKGFIVELIEHEGINSLYASVSGSKHSRLLLEGHIDVVPGADQPFLVDGDTVKGRGTYDMLFGTAAFMRLIDELPNPIADYGIAVMLTGDEEHGGLNGVKRLLQDDGYTTDICIMPDAGQGFGSMNIAAKGVYQPTIRINGRSHHGSRPWEGDSASTKLVQFLTEFAKAFNTSDQANSTMTIAGLQAGEAANQGPATAQTGLDIRYSDKADLARIEITLANLLKQYDGIIIETHRGDDFQLDMQNPDVLQFIKVYERYVGKPINFTKAHGSSDARFFNEKGMPVIMLRPDGGGAHGDEEWLSIASYDAFYAVLKEYVIDIAGKR